MRLSESISPGLEEELQEIKALDVDPKEILRRLYKMYFDSKGNRRYSSDDRAFMLEHAGHYASRRLSDNDTNEAYEKASRQFKIRRWSDKIVARELTIEPTEVAEEPASIGSDVTDGLGLDLPDSPDLYQE